MGGVSITLMVCETTSGVGGVGWVGGVLITLMACETTSGAGWVGWGRWGNHVGVLIMLCVKGASSCGVGGGVAG